MPKPKVLLINPGNTVEIYQGLSQNLSAIETPSLAALFATYLRLNDVDVILCDIAAGVGLQGFLELKPDLAVVVVYGFQPSASTQNMGSALIAAKLIKTYYPLLPVVFTGTHPSALPRATVSFPDIDYVIEGEGPQAILALAKNVPLKEIPGLHGKEFQNPIGPLIENLDTEMPHADWHHLPMRTYRSHNWHAFGRESRQPYASIHTSMGCPFKCSFCCINAPFSKPSYRMWSPDVVAKEIKHLHEQYGVTNIKFVDEMFVLNKDHVLGICDELIKLDLDLNIWAYARVDTVRPEFLEKLKRAGFRWLALGIESGSKHVRDGVEKGRFGTPEIIRVVREVQAAHIHVIGNYIFGLPDDTLDSMADTVNLALETNCEFANFYSAMPYPGSRLYTETPVENLPPTFSAYSQHSYDCTPLPTETLSASEVLRFRDSAFHTYFTNPRYKESVEAKFGPSALFEIEQMTKIKLKRKLLGD